MDSYKHFLLLFSFFFSINLHCIGQEVILLTPKDATYIIAPQTTFWIDTLNTQNFEQIIEKKTKKQFQHHTQKLYHFGFQPWGIWICLNIKNTQPEQGNEWLLEIAYPTLDYIDFYSQNSAGKWQKKALGDRRPFKNRDIAYKRCLIPLKLNDTLTHTYYLKISGEGVMQIPLKIHQPQYFYEKSLQEEIIYGIFYGTFVLMLLYNLVMWISQRDRNYFFYFIFISASGLFYFADSGYAFQYFWQAGTRWTNDVLIVSLGFMIIGAAVFAISFLNIKDVSPFLYKILLIGVGSGFLLILLIPVLSFSILVVLGFVITSLLAVLQFSAGIVSYLAGNLASRYFIMAWGAYLLGILVHSARDLGLIPPVFITLHATQIASILEVILISLALNDKYGIVQAMENQTQVQKQIRQSLEQKVQERTQELEQKQAQITQSLHYAQSIQHAILPNEDEILAYFSDYTLLYQPKDIVSGDFYWLTRINKYFFLAIVDCTGHGVPGAFMSMVGNSLLHEIINERQVFSPAAILSELHEAIFLRLRQNETNNNDGMDVALLRLEWLQDEQVITAAFAGAKLSAYVFQQEQLKEYKGNRIMIGGWNKSTESKTFQNQYFTLEKDDIIYLTTDGLTDIPNPDRKSFGKKRFKNTIAQLAKVPLSEQKTQLLQHMTTFQQNAEQRDDILFLALKV